MSGVSPFRYRRKHWASNHAVFAFLLLLASSLAFSQAGDSKSQKAQTKSPAANLPLQGQVEILTDTMGVDFGPYVTRAVEIIRTKWYEFIPPSAYPPTSKRGKVIIEFTIKKDGKAAGLKLYSSSGHVDLDRAAWASISASSPLPPLPKEFPGQSVGLRIHYYYNLGPDNPPSPPQ